MARIDHFLLVFCSNDVSILHHFRDNTSFTVYVTLSNLQFPYDSWDCRPHKLSNSYISIPYLCAIFYQVSQLERFQTAKVTFKVTQGRWYWCYFQTMSSKNWWKYIRNVSSNFAYTLKDRITRPSALPCFAEITTIIFISWAQC